MKTKQTKQMCAKCEAEGEQCFWVCDGPVVKNLSELKDALKTMSVEQFNYHTKRDGNDFVNWVENVLQCSKCVASLKKAKTKVGALRALEQCC